MKNTISRTYSELITIDDYYQRLEYLMLYQTPGVDTFGGLRLINQTFYNSVEWKHIRNRVLDRDNFCDLGFPGYEITGSLFVHHMNPVTPDILKHDSDLALDPEFLITVSRHTHQHIHYGRKILRDVYVERTPGDTTLW